MRSTNLEHSRCLTDKLYLDLRSCSYQGNPLLILSYFCCYGNNDAIVDLLSCHFSEVILVYPWHDQWIFVVRQLNWCSEQDLSFPFFSPSIPTNAHYCVCICACTHPYRYSQIQCHFSPGQVAAQMETGNSGRCLPAGDLWHLSGC